MTEDLDLRGVRPDPELSAAREPDASCPDCPNCGHFSTRLPRGRFWCANFRCDAVFTVGGPVGLAIIGRVARLAGIPVTILPTKRARDLGARLDEGLGEEVPISTTDMTWYALCVEVGREADVKDDLGVMRLAAYVPLLSYWRQARRRLNRKGGPEWTEVERPIFPGYVMMGAWRGYAVDWIAVREIDHAHGPVLTTDDAPSVLPGDQIRSLILREASGEFRGPLPRALRKRGAKSDVKPGDEVEIEGTEYADKIAGIDGIRAVLANSGLKVHLSSLRKVG
jgi:transcription antitermination factor NusG